MATYKLFYKYLNIFLFTIYVDVCVSHRFDENLKQYFLKLIL